MGTRKVALKDAAAIAEVRLSTEASTSRSCGKARGKESGSEAGIDTAIAPSADSTHSTPDL